MVQSMAFLLFLLGVGISASASLSVVGFEKTDDLRSFEPPGYTQFALKRQRGTNNFLESEACSSDRWSSALSNEGLDWNQKTRQLQKYVDECSDKNVYSKGSLRGFIDSLRLKYFVQRVSPLNSVDIRFSDDSQLQGLLAMHEVKAPLVIVKCGIFCSMRDLYTLRNPIMQFYEEAGAHILIVENISSTIYSTRNKTFSFEGVEGGLQLSELVRYIKKEQSLVDMTKVTSVHVAGSSLGALSALYSSLFSRASGVQIDGVMAICPVVSMKNSIRRLGRKGLVPKGMRQILKNHLTEIAEKSAFFRMLLNQSKDKKNLFFEMALSHYSELKKRFPKGSPYPDPFGTHELNSLEDYWALNDFSRWAHLSETPTLFIGSEDDPVVRVKENMNLLDYDKQASFYRVLYQRGKHCGFDVANGWRNYSQLLGQFIQDHDTPAEDASTQMLEPFHVKPFFQKSWVSKLRFGPDESILQHMWTLKEGDEMAHLRLIIRTGCGPSGSKKGLCTRKYNVSIPIEKLFPGRKIPRGYMDENRMERLLNTRTHLVDKFYQSVLHRRVRPHWVLFDYKNIYN